MGLDRPGANESLADSRHRYLHRIVSSDSHAGDDQIAVYKREVRAGTDILNLGERPINMMGTSLDGVADYDVPEQEFYPSPGPVACRVYLEADQDVTNGSYQHIQFETVNFDMGNDFNTSSYLFTAPCDGFYQVNSALYFKEAPADQKAVLYAIYKNAAAYSVSGTVTAAAAVNGIHISDIVPLARGDTIKMYLNHAHTEARTLDGQSHLCYLSIARLQL